MKDASPPGCMTRRPVKPEPVAAPEARCVFVKVSSTRSGEPAARLMEAAVVHVAVSKVTSVMVTPFSPGSLPGERSALPVNCA